MKFLNLIIAFVLFFATTTIQANPISSNPTEENPTPKTRLITLKKGTKITLTLNESLHSRDVENGKVVEMMVFMDVMINGEKVITSGAYAEGLVTSVRKAGIFGRGAKLEFEGINIRSVDGNRIPISSVKVRSYGKNRKGAALGASILIPTVGVLMGTPILIPFGVVGVFIKGREVEIEEDRKITAKIMEDIQISVPIQ